VESAPAVKRCATSASSEQRHLTRPAFLGTTAVLAAAGSLESCSSSPSYDSVIAQTYRPFDGHLIERNALNRELVRYATLAPSSHNTQCWKFEVGDRHVSTVPDFTRRLQAVDSDDHHLFVSLGCATENLVQAARANGLRGNVRLDPLRNAVRVAFEPAKPVVSPLFGAIPLRQCPRAPYDGKTVPAGDLRTLEAAAGGTGVRILSSRRRALSPDLVVRFGYGPAMPQSLRRSIDDVIV